MNDGIILRTSPEFTALRKNLLQAIERTARRATAFDSFGNVPDK